VREGAHFGSQPGNESDPGVTERGIKRRTRAAAEMKIINARTVQASVIGVAPVRTSLYARALSFAGLKFLIDLVRPAGALKAAAL
jgi:hypothetical protein